MTWLAQRIASSLLLLLLIGACGERTSTTDAGRTRDSAGIRIVVSDTPAWAPGTEWRTGSSDVELGSDASQGSPLANVTSISLTSDERAVIADAGSDVVILFDPGTGRSQILARKGSGPGEVLGLFRAWVAPGDTIVTWDFRNRRVQFFGPDGRYMRGLRLDERALGEWAFPVGPLPDGRLLVVIRPGLVSGDLPPGRDSALYLRVTADSLRVVDSLALLPDLERYTVALKIGGQVFHQRQFMLFGRSTQVATTGHGFVVADNATWEIRSHDAEGHLTMVARRDVTPEAVTAGEVSDYRRRFEEAMRLDKTMPPDLVAQLIEDGRNAPHATTKPAFGSVVPGLDGSLWVRAYAPTGETQKGSYSVLDRSGTYLGDVTLPEDMLLMAVGNGALWVVDSSTGAPVVRRLPLVKQDGD